jgi:RHS repeat-associated protein
VTGATGGTQAAESFAYDTNGNRTGSGVTVSAFNRVTNDGTYTYLYDNEGNRTRRTKTSNGEYELYVWDYRQRLVSVTLKNSANVTQQTVVYEYDGLNRRIRRTVSNSAGTVTAKQRFLYDSNVLSSPRPRIRGEGQDEGAIYEVVLVLDELASGLPYQQVDHRFMNGPAIDQVFADEGSGTGNQVLWYLSDAQHTVRDVAKYTNTTSGSTAKIRNHLEYDSFGNVTSVDDPTTGANTSDGDLPGLEGSGNEYSPQRSYTGREPDAATGLIYYRARWFDPKLGRFISEDPIGFAAGDANLSRYVGNSTPNATDPTGLDYREDFLNSLPDDVRKALEPLEGLLKEKPEVHHTWQQQEAIKEWLKKRGIDVDDVTHLRYVPKHVHTQITNQQNEFRRLLGEEFGLGRNPSWNGILDAAQQQGKEAWLFQRMQEFNEGLETSYGKYWLKPGATMKDLNAMKKSYGLARDCSTIDFNSPAARRKIAKEFMEVSETFWETLTTVKKWKTIFKHVNWKRLEVVVFFIGIIPVLETTAQGAQHEDVVAGLNAARNQLDYLERNGTPDPEELYNFYSALRRYSDAMNLDEFQQYLIYLNGLLKELEYR